MVLLIVRGLLRRPSLSGSPTVSFCSVHNHNVVAKKRDASTELLQRLHGYMREHNVDFIGGDFNMSAFSTVGDVFTDAEFSAPGNSILWGPGALEEPNRECAKFLIMPKRPYEWRVHSHGCYKLTRPRFSWTSRPICSSPLCSFIFALLICRDPAASCVVSKHNKEDLSADTTKNVRGDDVHDRALVRQGLVSVSFLTLLRSRVSLLLVCCSLHLHCRLDVLIQVCVCVFVCLFLQRCSLVIALPQPSQLPVPNSLLDAAVQTTPPCDASQDVSTQTSDQQVSSLTFDVAVQTVFPQCPHLIFGRCRADDPTQYSISARFYADGFSLSFLVFC